MPPTWLFVPADHSGDMESSWGDLVEQAERPPGRAVHLHQRLSSPSRKRLASQLHYQMRLSVERVWHGQLIYRQKGISVYFVLHLNQREARDICLEALALHEIHFLVMPFTSKKSVCTS